MSLHPQKLSLFRTLQLIAVVVSLPLLALAQGGVGSSRGLPSTSGGIHTIQGKVYFPGTGGNRRVKVRLDSANFVSQSVQTDDDGAFRFNQLEAGPYTITVDGGSDFENAVETVAIDREASNGGRIVSVPIYLQPKPDASVPAGAVDLYRKAQQALKANNGKKAIENLTAALTIHPDFTLALSELGGLYMKTNEMAKAAETYTKLVALTPNDLLAHQNLGIALFNLKKIDEAEVHLQEALKINDKLPSAHYYLGLVLVNKKAYADAEKELELAINNGGDNLALAHRYLGGLYMGSKKNQQAADELEKYLKLEPKAADADRIKNTIKELRNAQ
ncbi:MAG TPA: tetratricopeptide repeat protein [Pyrinomonadaceae bacterium]